MTGEKCCTVRSQEMTIKEKLVKLLLKFSLHNRQSLKQAWQAQQFAQSPKQA